MSPPRRPERAAGAVGLKAGNEHAGVLLEVMPARDLADEGNVLASQADEAAADAAILDQPRHHPARRVARDRETNALRRADDAVFTPMNLAVRVDEWAAGVAGVQRRVRLNDIVDQPARGAAQ